MINNFQFNSIFRFILDLYDCHTTAGTSYVSILNSQIKVFDLLQSERLEARLRNVCQTVKSKRRNLRNMSMAKREKFPHEVKQVSVLKSEILNVEQVRFESFTTEPSVPMDYSSHMDLSEDWSAIPYESPDLETSAQDMLDLDMMVENIKQGESI